MSTHFKCDICRKEYECRGDASDTRGLGDGIKIEYKFSDTANQEIDICKQCQETLLNALEYKFDKLKVGGD